jgi:hypothetical protein
MSQSFQLTFQFWSLVPFILENANYKKAAQKSKFELFVHKI